MTTTMSEEDTAYAMLEEIDELLVRNLELMQEKIRKSIEMENLLKNGYIELAKARYIRGKESIGILQVPNDEDTVKSLFDLRTEMKKTTDGDDDGDAAPNFDVSLKKSNVEEDGPSDPLKWFGVLVPQNLKNSQKRFQESVYLAASIANTQAELDSVRSRLETLRTQKDSLCSS